MGGELFDFHHLANLPGLTLEEKSRGDSDKDGATWKPVVSRSTTLDSSAHDVRHCCWLTGQKKAGGEETPVLQPRDNRNLALLPPDN